ncbi:alpha/beta fold hydrolase [Promicromonospora sp. Marseille-Q5078]
MNVTSWSRRRFGATIGVAVLALSIGTTAAQADISQHRDQSSHAKPTIVLVHGAFADGSGWNGVIAELQHDGYPVIAAANPLRSLEADSAYVRSIIDSVDGDVVLVGHSYGGGVITNAATGADNVDALVYVAGHAPDKGETVGQFSDPEQYPGSELTPDSLVTRPYAGGADITIDPARFRQIFAADLPASEARLMAATQRPADVSILEEPSPGEPAWKTIPSWYQVSSDDKALSPVAQRFFAKRMGAHTTEVKASHVGFISHPKTTANVIESAARATD